MNAIIARKTRFDGSPVTGEFINTYVVPDGCSIVSRISGYIIPAGVRQVSWKDIDGVLEKWHEPCEGMNYAKKSGRVNVPPGCHLEVTKAGSFEPSASAILINLSRVRS